MPRYIVERSFSDRFPIAAGPDGADRCRTVVERNADEAVTWLHSYVSDDGRRRSASTTRPHRRRSARRPCGTSSRSTGSHRSRPRPVLLHTLEVIMTCCFAGSGRPVAGPAIAGASPWASLPWPFNSAHPRGREQFLRDTGDQRPDRSCDRVGCIDELRESAGRRFGRLAGCSLYLLTSDQLHALSGAHFACSDRLERHRAAVRHRPLAGAPHRGCPDRRAGRQSQPARDGDPHRPAGLAGRCSR